MHIIVITIVLLSTVKGENIGYTDNNDGQWAYSWYRDEPFILTCMSPRLNVSAGEQIVWQTPDKVILPANYSSESYGMRSRDGMTDVDLVIKSVKPELHGVYVCSVYPNNSAEAPERMIIGLNLHGEKFKTFLDKYHHNIIVAVVSTAVFLFPLGTSCLAFHFRYVSAEEKSNRKERKAQRKLELKATTEVQNDIPMQEKSAMNDGPESHGGHGSYDNPVVTEGL